MMKSKLYIIALSVLLLFGGTSCSNWLDVKPESQIILEDYWRSESDVDAVLAACYRGLISDDNVYRMIVWGELRSDDLTYGGSIPNERYDLQRLLEGNISPTNSYCSWGSFYSVINYCNTLLYYAPYVIDRDENFTEDDLHHVQAEARAIRALCYFYLVRTFKEVPWIEDASIDDTQNFNKEKSKEPELIAHIIADLQFAQQYARTDFGNENYNKGRFTLNSVNALLADVYLWNQQYDKCVETCNSVLADKQLKLVKSELMYSTVFNNGNSTESILELQFDDKVQKNNPVFNLYGYSSDVLGDFSFPATLAYDVQNKYYGAYSPFNYSLSSTLHESANDIRQKDFLNMSLASGGKYYIFKYSGIRRIENINGISSYFYRTNTCNWILYRLSDVMLMKAEALVQMGESNYHEAIKMVNIPYLRANTSNGIVADSLYVTNYPTKSEMEKLVLRERQRELMFEGKRWFDLVRLARREQSTSSLNEYVDHKASTSGASLAVSSLDGLYMPISQSELKANPNLKQNPYYTVSSSSSR
ncbi:RagB/SusD family nutrient uptake outer membrane protein [Parabacteroides sp. FAFU027]|uniref:RagB/SusD family nutrient uptake outer membrane protein n=1 Tax=Parabacteroides sp. FAFU027 TaxID=2922715 RepID=UPI001FAE7F1E|nr:RagB/SusD family nutrient uptake outer membrane protein [Parabacteroides sp. FAFU027]